MTSEIDNQVVSMTFDNAVFERHLAQTIGSLDKLRISIDQVAKTKSLDGLAKSANGIDFSKSKASLANFSGEVGKFKMTPMVEQVAGVSKSFVAMTTIAITALASVTAAAVAAGGQAAKAFAITPITDGFKEFETNMGSIQTILANTDKYGTTLDQVTGALDELNRYSDKTIYNFGDMVKNIGLFTNAGIRIEDATSMIQGFSNVAAASGTNAQGAASAAYQLSQALSAGKVTLMDWKSLQTVGMGNKNMQGGIIDIANAMGTMEKAGVTTEEATNGFNASLEKGWLSADVMSNYLKIMAGDMDDAGMAALGLSDDQIAAFNRQQEIAENAATKVRTFTQLISTVKESIGSGWSETFRTVLGGFNESTELFTSLNNYIGGFVSRSANARNKMLGEWKAFGGRDVLIQGFKNLAKSVTAIVKPINKAFREMFPKTTTADLLKMTKAFADWAKRLEPGKATLEKIKVVATGFFDALSIGWAIIKESVKALKSLWDQVTDGGKKAGGAALGVARFVTHLKEILVDGKGIHNFFQGLADGFAKIINFGKKLFTAITGIFRAFDQGGDSTGRAGDRLSFFGNILEKIGSILLWVRDRFSDLSEGGGKVIDKITKFAGDMGKKFKDMMDAGDFSGIWDVFNAGILVGFLVVLKKVGDAFSKLSRDGLSFTHAFTAGDGLFGKIAGTFDQLTGVLKAMQTEIKARALLNIAIAVAVLTASLLVLSMIDSAALTKALLAISVGFAQMIVTMTALDHLISSSGSAAKLTILSIALIALAVAVAILAVAVKIFSTMDSGEIARGLAGVAGGIAIMVAALKVMDGDTDGMIRAGLAMGAMALGMLLLSLAVKAFGQMDWDVMKQGLIGAAAGLAMMVLAMNLMPPGGLLTAIGVVVLAGALLLLQKAVEAFGTMDWDVMKQGLIGIGIALAGIALAMWAMPPSMPLVALGLIAVGYAVGLIAGVIETLGTLKFEVVKQGLIAMGLAMLILAAGAWAMQTALPGAAAMVVMAGALTVLTKVLTTLGKMKTGDIIKGLLAMAGVFLVLGLAALLLGPVSPAILALGVAVATVGLAFALFGVGVFLLAKGLELLASAGVAGAKAVVESLGILIGAVPKYAGQIVDAIVAIVTDLLDALPPIIENLGKIVGLILDKFIELYPKLQTAMDMVVSGMIESITKNGPKLIEAIVTLLDQLVTSLASHSESIAQGLADLISGALDGLASRTESLVTSLIGFFVSIFEALGLRVSEVVEAYTNFLVSLFTSIADSIEDVVSAFVLIFVAVFNAIGEAAADIVDAFVGMLVSIIEAIGDANQDLVDAFVDVVVGFIEGAADATEKIGTAVVALVLAIAEQIKLAGEASGELAEAGGIALARFLDGIANAIDTVCPAAGRVISAFVGCLLENPLKLIGAGVTNVGSFVSGIGNSIGTVLTKGREVGQNVVSGIAEKFGDLVSSGRKAVTRVTTGIGEMVSSVWEKAKTIGSNILQGIRDGITNGWDSITSWLKTKSSSLVDTIKQPWEIFSPSRVMFRMGENITAGLANGMRDSWQDPVAAADNMSRKVLGNVETNMGKLKQALDMSAMGFGGVGLNPVIAPVLDLSGVRSEAKRLGDILSISSIDPGISYQQAQQIAFTTDETAAAKAAASVPSGPTEVSFTQIVNSPKALNTAAMYRQSRSIVQLAKDELGIPTP